MAAWSYPWVGFGDIFDSLGSAEVHELFRHIDPAYQPQRFSQTVYLLRAGNDGYSTPDSTMDFYQEMSKYQKIYIRTLPNALHEVDDRFLSGVIGFYVSSHAKNLLR
jgi:PhoPQ-activated pathogenicity-related protein